MVEKYDKALIKLYGENYKHLSYEYVTNWQNLYELATHLDAKNNDIFTKNKDNKDTEVVSESTPEGNNDKQPDSCFIKILVLSKEVDDYLKDCYNDGCTLREAFEPNHKVKEEITNELAVHQETFAKAWILRKAIVNGSVVRI